MIAYCSSSLRRRFELTSAQPTVTIAANNRGGGAVGYAGVWVGNYERALISKPPPHKALRIQTLDRGIVTMILHLFWIRLTVNVLGEDWSWHSELGICLPTGRTHGWLIFLLHEADLVTYFHTRFERHFDSAEMFLRSAVIFEINAHISRKQSNNENNVYTYVYM